MLVKYRVFPYFKILFTVSVWGASFIATKVALQDVSPVTVVWLRFTVGVLILGGTVAWRRQLSLPRLRELPSFALLGFLGITFHQWLQSTGLLTAQASTTAWIVAATPVFMALLGWLALKEKMGFIKVTGIILAALGVLLVVSQGNLVSLLSGRFGTPGDFLILISAVNWAVFSILSRPVLQRCPPAWLMFYVMLLGWLMTSVQLFTGPSFSEINQLTTNGWLGIGFLGVFCSGLAYIFYYDALQVIPASQVGVFLNLAPLVAVVVAGIILGEAAYPAALLGGAAILLGVWLVNK